MTSLLSIACHSSPASSAYTRLPVAAVPRVDFPGHHHLR
jgi:hypothetical protein